MDSCPKELEPFLAAYKLQRNREDVSQWQLGQYITAAISTIGKGKYPKEPMFQIRDNTGNSDYKESKEEVAVFEMKQRINILKKQGLPESPI